MRIGYLLAEFPGATHSFNWREVRALEAGGLTCDLVSTQKPSADKMSHVWTKEAVDRATYLVPPRPMLLLGGIWSILRSGPRGWGRVVSAIFGAEGIGGLKGRVRLAVLAIMGGELAWLARRRGWEYVQVHSLADTSHVAMFAHLISGQRYGLTLHANLVEFGPNQRNKWKHAAYAICITHRLRDSIRRDLPDTIPRQIDVAPMGVELDRFTRSSQYEPWTGRDRARLFSCGRQCACSGVGPGSGRTGAAAAQASFFRARRRACRARFISRWRSRRLMTSIACCRVHWPLARRLNAARA